MASRHVDVNERRLRPVYGIFFVNLLSSENSEISKENDYLTICVLLTDALDSMNNKQAIQLADKILKKQKDLHCAKVTVTLIFKQQTLIPAIAL